MSLALPVDPAKVTLALQLDRGDGLVDVLELPPVAVSYREGSLVLSAYVKAPTVPLAVRLRQRVRRAGAALRSRLQRG